MGGYQSLYRKYRPLSLEDLVGQEHIGATLKRAALTKKFVHCYLFNGKHGTGKTSTARILAAMLNCENLKEDGNPCGECTSCKVIRADASPDLIELDGARNGKVENINSLIESVRWPPQQLSKKVFIIDECHCLSGGAISALLKVTEEPPPYVTFIFCTTEAQKVIPTILSRGQRFNFKMITSKDIVSRLTTISTKEGIQIDTDGLWLLAKMARGSMRDSITSLEMIATLADGRKIVAGSVEKYFGLPKKDVIVQIAKAVIDQDVPQVLDLVNDLVLISTEPQEILREIAEVLRNIMVLKVPNTRSDLVDIPDSDIQVLKSIGGDVTVGQLAQMTRFFSQVDKKITYSINERWTMEAALISCIALLRSNK